MRTPHLGNMQLTSSCIQSAIAVVTLEMFCFLVRDEDLQVVKVTFAVVAPRTVQELLERGTASFFTHCSVNSQSDSKTVKVWWLQRRRGLLSSQIQKLAITDEAKPLSRASRASYASRGKLRTKREVRTRLPVSNATINNRGKEDRGKIKEQERLPLWQYVCTHEHSFCFNIRALP